MKHVIIIGLVLAAIMISGCTEMVETDRHKTITVVDKTAEVVPAGFSTRTDYKVLADDGTVYHTTWEIYRGLEINGSYQIQAHNKYSMGLADPDWKILLVERRDR